MVWLVLGLTILVVLLVALVLKKQQDLDAIEDYANDPDGRRLRRTSDRSGDSNYLD